MIAAMPAVLRKHPDAVYRIVGATHPKLVAQDGESYREGLMNLAEDLGITHAIIWDNRFLESEELLDQLEAQVIDAALRRHGGNKTRVAEELGLTRVGLRMKLSRLGLGGSE